MSFWEVVYICVGVEMATSLVEGLLGALFTWWNRR